MNLWQAAHAAAFGHMRPDPEPRLTRRDHAVAEQFSDDLDSIVTDLASEVSRYGAKVRDGERDCPSACEREEMLTELKRWAAKAKQMRKGEI